MTRIRHGQKRWRMKWPWNRLFPLRVDERYCSACKLLYHNGPLPRELKQFNSGSVAAIILPAGGYRSHSCVVNFGRWKSFSGTFQFSNYIPQEELDDLFEVAVQTREYLDAFAKTKRMRR